MGKNKKDIVNLLSAELAQRVVKVNMVGGVCVLKINENIPLINFYFRFTINFNYSYITQIERKVPGSNQNSKL